MIKEIKPATGRSGSRRGKKEGRGNGEESFGNIIAALRKEKKLNQKQLASEISRDCARALGREPITDKAISKWERGDSLPDAQQFISLCRVLGISDVLAVFRGLKSGYDPFAGLNRLGRDRAEEYISLLCESQYFSTDLQQKQSCRQIPLYDLPASAGTGVFLDGSSYTMIDADETVPDAATFAVRISGDSMDPMFRDGQVVYVRQQQVLNSGEIGIFVLNGEAYCKKLDTENGAHLVSLNPKYKPIKLADGAELRIVGRVVG